jgi:hypothetical protein
MDLKIYLTKKYYLYFNKVLLTKKIALKMFCQDGVGRDCLHYTPNIPTALQRFDASP